MKLCALYYAAVPHTHARPTDSLPITIRLFVDSQAVCTDDLLAMPKLKSKAQ